MIYYYCVNMHGWVCICVWTCVDMCGHAQEHVQTRIDIWCLPHSLSTLLRQDFLMNSELPNLDSLTSQLALRNPCVWPKSCYYSGLTYSTSIFLSPGDPNFILRACRTNTFPAKSSSLLLTLFIYIWLVLFFYLYMRM